MQLLKEGERHPGGLGPGWTRQDQIDAINFFRREYGPEPLGPDDPNAPPKRFAERVVPADVLADSGVMVTNIVGVAETAETTESAGENPRKSSPRKGRGRPASNFGHSLMSDILGLLQSGYGRSTICVKLGIGYNRFLRVLRTNPEFAECVRMAENAREESCELCLFQIVNSDNDPRLKLRAANSYLGRR